jgi:hypothetical protein
MLVPALLALGSLTVIHVDLDAPPPGDGTSWPGAFATLDAGLAAAGRAPGPVEVWIAAGTYVPTARDDPREPRSATFRVPPGCSLRGGFRGDEATPAGRAARGFECVLSGDLAGDDGPAFANRADNAFHVVVLHEPTPETRVERVVVRGGNATGLPGGAVGLGGGVLVDNALGGRPTLARCLLEDNQADSGGGAATLAPARFEDCVLRANRALHPTSGLGGGLAHWGVANEVDLVGCLFAGNTAQDGGGVSTFYGGVLAFGSTFVGNQASGIGGGLGIQGPGSTLGLTGCILWDNVDGAGAGERAQVWAPASFCTEVLEACDVQGWSGALQGVACFAADPRFENPLGQDGLPHTGDESWRLTTGSPCIDAGVAAMAPHACTGRALAVPERDLDGLPRSADGDLDGVALPDLGAHELAPAPDAPLRVGRWHR